MLPTSSTGAIGCRKSFLKQVVSLRKHNLRNVSSLSEDQHERARFASSRGRWMIYKTVAPNCKNEISNLSWVTQLFKHSSTRASAIWMICELQDQLLKAGCAKQ